MLKILTTPNSVLTLPVKKVERFAGKLSRLVNDMEQTLASQKDPQGVGLAAPQVGDSLAIFIIKPHPEAKVEVFINPKIVETEDENSKPDIPVKTQTEKTQSKNTPAQNSKRRHKLEGCLSIPRIWGPVKRHRRVYLEYHDLKGNLHKKWFSGFKSVIIQHEVDHLKGVLFTQRALEQNAQLYEEKDGDLVKILTK